MGSLESQDYSAGANCSYLGRSIQRAFNVRVGALTSGRRSGGGGGGGGRRPRPVTVIFLVP